MKEMIRVLIADDSAAFGKACQKELKSGGQPGDLAAGHAAL